MKLLSREEYHKILAWRKILGKEDCPFCLVKDKNQIYYDWKKWFLLYALSPYSGNDKHLMAVPKRHVCFTRDLTGEEFLELKEIHNIAKDFFKEENYFSTTRETIEARSVEHLHIHFVPWKLQGKFIRKMLELQGFPIKQDLSVED